MLLYLRSYLVFLRAFQCWLAHVQLTFIVDACCVVLSPYALLLSCVNLRVRNLSWSAMSVFYLCVFSMQRCAHNLQARVLSGIPWRRAHTPLRPISPQMHLDLMQRILGASTPPNLEEVESVLQFRDSFRPYSHDAVVEDPVAAWEAVERELEPLPGLPPFDMTMKMEQVRIN